MPCLSPLFCYLIHLLNKQVKNECLEDKVRDDLNNFELIV